MTTYDVIIIGAGPGGLAAATYSARYTLKTLVIGALPGGTMAEAHEVCNYPGYEKIKGFELGMKMAEQVKANGVEIKQTIVTDIKKLENGTFEVSTPKESFTTKKVIISTGLKRRHLNIEREKELSGKGVSYCATCDGMFYKDKIVGVVGGGNAALTAARLLAEYAKKVYILYRGKEFLKAEPAWVADINKNSKIEPMFKIKVEKLLGEEKLEAVRLNNGEALPLDGIFIEIGSDPQVDLAEKAGVEVDEKGYIKTDEYQKTNVHGIFAAGDITNNVMKQITVATAEGTIAAKTAYDEIRSEEQ